MITVDVQYENEFDSDQLFLFDAALESTEYEEEEEIGKTSISFQLLSNLIYRNDDRSADDSSFDDSSADSKSEMRRCLSKIRRRKV